MLTRIAVTAVVAHRGINAVVMRKTTGAARQVLRAARATVVSLVKNVVPIPHLVVK